MKKYVNLQVHIFINIIRLTKFGQPKKDETLYVSAAASCVGQLAGQLGKTFGMNVIGSAGSDEKVEFLKEFGFDNAFNYKTNDINTKLEEQAPKGIDVYYDNVGGKTLEAAINHLNHYSRYVWLLLFFGQSVDRYIER